MLLPLPAFTDSMPSTLTVGPVYAGGKAGAATTYAFWPYQHTAYASAKAGAASATAFVDLRTVYASAKAGVSATLTFAGPATFTAAPLIGAKAGVTATISFVAVGVLVGAKAGVSSTVTFVSGDKAIIASLPTPLTSVFRAPNLGQVAAPLTLMTASAAGVQGGFGAAVASLPRPLTSVFRMGERIVASLPRPVTGVLTGFAANTGRVTASLIKPTAVLAGYATVQGTVVAELIKPTAALTGYATVQGGIVSSIRTLRGVFSGSIGATGGIVGRLTVLTAAIAGRSSIYGAIVVNLPRPITSVLASVQPWTYVDTLVTNTVTSSLTQYDTYNFNSFAQVGDRFLAAKADGIYAVHEGDLDDAAPIAASFATGALDFGVRELKRAENLYAAYTTAGNLKVTVTPDKGVSHSYTLAANRSGFGPRRVTIGKGMRGRHWKIRVSNINGVDFDFTSMEAVFAQTARHV